MKAGFFTRLAAPQRIQRFQCVTCQRYFSSQTFHFSYWLRRPELSLPIFHRLLGCSALRQIAREFDLSPQTVQRRASRLGRLCLLFHQQNRPRGPLNEPVVLDSFASFEYSQYHPTLFHVLAGKNSHFFHGFTDSELRRSGSMRPAQKQRRAALEAVYGRPDPRSIEKEVKELLQIVAPEPQAFVLHTDEHLDYPRAVRQLKHLEVTHRTISSRAARTSSNPLHVINLLDLLLRHCGANHKRETIAFSKRRQGAAERIWAFVVWRNYIKSVSERHPGETPAMRLGLRRAPLRPEGILTQRLFPTRIALPPRWAKYYWRQIRTRMILRGTTHQLAYAF